MEYMTLKLIFPTEIVEIPHAELPKAHGLPIMNPRPWLKANRPDLIEAYNRAEQKKIINSLRFETSIQ